MKRLVLILVCIITGHLLNYGLGYSIHSLEYWAVMFPYFIAGCIYKFKTKEA